MSYTNDTFFRMVYVLFWKTDSLEWSFFIPLHSRYSEDPKSTCCCLARGSTFIFIEAKKKASGSDKMERYFSFS